MPDLIVTRGLPASGKSTWAKAWVAVDPENRVRVNRDDLRHMMFGAYWGEGVNEDAVSVAEEAVVRDSLKKGKSVVIDATHLRASYIKKWAKIQPVTIKEFAAPLSVLEIRDEMRIQTGQRGVGPGVISGLAKRFHIKEDGALPAIDISEIQSPVFKPAPPWDENKDSAIIVDIDGTLANHEPHRGPYDTSLYHLDAVHDDIRGAVNIMAGTHYVVVTSGRSEDFREVTEAWLRNNFIQFDELVMRPSGDTRNDAIVKHELFHERIAPRYNIALVFDDRNRVVDMWREIGLTCAQVNYGDF